MTPDEAASMVAPAPRFMCELSDNDYDLEFRKFTVRHLDGEKAQDLVIIGGVPEDEAAAAAQREEVEKALAEDPDCIRTVQYPFGKDFLDYKCIGTELEFSVGPMELKELRMIETHFFRDKILKQYDFTMPFCMPNSVNTWEVIYEMPELDAATKADIIASPWEVVSDSFYFVGNKLVMHTKASYDYSC